MERKQHEIKFEIDRKEQEYRLRIEKSRLEMERLSEENGIKVAEAKMVEIEYLEESEIDQHLEQASSVDRRSDRVNDWVDHALENPKRTQGSSVFFKVWNLYKYRKWFAATQKCVHSGSFTSAIVAESDFWLWSTMLSLSANRLLQRWRWNQARGIH